MLTPHRSDVLSVPKFVDGSVQYFKKQTKTNWLSIPGWFFCVCSSWSSTVSNEEEKFGAEHE